MTSPEKPADNMEPMPEADSPKNWTEDYSHENGNYHCKCSVCGSMFIGHKRRVVCKECAKPSKPAQRQTLEQAAEESYGQPSDDDLYEYGSDSEAIFSFGYHTGFLACGNSEWHQQEMERFGAKLLRWIESEGWVNKGAYNKDVRYSQMNPQPPSEEDDNWQPFVGEVFSPEELIQRFKEENGKW